MRTAWLHHVAHAAQHTLLFAAARLVPSSQRADWLREWTAELWHARHSIASPNASSRQSEHTLFAFCIGSFPDAWCIRRHDTAQAAPIHSSAVRTIMALAAVLALLVICCLLLPGLRAERDTTRNHLRSGLLLIQSEDDSPATPVVTAGQFYDWQSTDQRYFDGLAFYATSHQTATLNSGRAFNWKVARTSGDLFRLLGLPIQPSGLESVSSNSAPSVVLSYNTWVSDFNSDPDVAGRAIHIGPLAARIAGVAPSISVQLPTNPDVWVLGAPSTAASTKGFVLALLSPLGQYAAASLDGRLPIDVNGNGEQTLNLVGVSLYAQAFGFWQIAGFSLFLALLALPAVVSVSISETSFSSHRPSWKRRIYRSLFLAAKCTLAVAIAGSGALMLAYGWSGIYSPTAEMAQFAAGFTFTLFGLRWALLDQQQRCPVCLRRVTHPASVGSASQTFLGWNGTEMMCVGGHTLLHVPSLPTSWFGAQRWLYLDTSWEFLFADLTPY